MPILLASHGYCCLRGTHTPCSILKEYNELEKLDSGSQAALSLDQECTCDHLCHQKLSDKHASSSARMTGEKTIQVGAAGAEHPGSKGLDCSGASGQEESRGFACEVQSPTFATRCVARVAAKASSRIFALTSIHAAASQRYGRIELRLNCLQARRR